MSKENIYSKFKELFGKDPLIVRSPGRVNLIGEHTDYNDGFVLPAAIDKAVIFAAARNNTSDCHLFSFDLNESHTFSLDEFSNSGKGWPNYLMGVADQVIKMGKLIGGFDCVFGGNIPLGAGLSSSAAIECAMAFTLNELFNLGLSKFEMVKLSQKAENDFVGVKCGIMDQFASMFGQKNKVIKLDCRSLDYEYFTFDMSGIKIVLCDTQVKHSLASSEYNTRRIECEQAVGILQKHDPEVKALRDVAMETINKYRDELGELVYKRAKHVVEENQRVTDACEALNRNDHKKFGELMYLSHEGLSKEYEVSCRELDFLVEETRNDDNVLGARMMGGGFGGCTINLVKEDYVDEFTKKMTNAYKKALGLTLKVYIDSIADGTSVVK